MPAAPIPPPMHMVTMPYFEPRRFISFRICTVSFVPVAPIGWPRAMAPPFTFILSVSRPTSRTTASTWAANASLNSMRSMSSSGSPACASASGAAALRRRPPAGEPRGGERLVDLDEVDVLQREPGLLQHLRDGDARPDPHDLGPHPPDGEPDEPRHRREAPPPGPPPPHPPPR